MSAAARLESALRLRNHGNLPAWFVSALDAPGGDGLLLAIRRGTHDHALGDVSTLHGGRARAGSAWWEGLPVAMREAAACDLAERGASSVGRSLLGAAVGWWLRARTSAGLDGAGRKARNASTGSVVPARNPRAARRRARRHGTSK